MMVVEKKELAVLVLLVVLLVLALVLQFDRRPKYLPPRAKRHSLRILQPPVMSSPMVLTPGKVD